MPKRDFGIIKVFAVTIQGRGHNRTFVSQDKLRVGPDLALRLLRLLGVNLIVVNISQIYQHESSEYQALSTREIVHES